MLLDDYLKPYTDDIADILVDSKNLIGSEGWITEELHTNEGYCLLGAIREVTNGVDAYYDDRYTIPPDRAAVEVVENYLKEYQPVAWQYSGDITEWNDKICVDKDDAMSLLESVVERIMEDAN